MSSAGYSEHLNTPSDAHSSPDYPPKCGKSKAQNRQDKTSFEKSFCPSSDALLTDSGEERVRGKQPTGKSGKIKDIFFGTPDASLVWQARAVQINH